ncbi:hypothetical protein GPECTOR_50g663 [Gonium pectorale]|uniref:Uncharacterized protein n=1 Tax=Gonium pectorale TaxID=33097 RepID=A0A150G7N2_GONPE|nr:hypothetical protein GPECTOR_50g663 [Gonium pectorale]|eukprot:KXZ45869.1 hypothetical protein GPECTOR_50g663 [Gonium pectorale]
MATASRRPGDRPAPAAGAAAVAVTGTGAAAGAAGAAVPDAANRYQAFQEAWDAGVELEAAELPEGAWLQVTEGVLPPELTGTYFRNGPARPDRATAEGLAQGASSSASAPPRRPHPLDGDGLVAAVCFRGDGRAAFRSAFVRTAELEAEARAGRQLFRGTFGPRQRPPPAAAPAAWPRSRSRAPANPASLGVALQGSPCWLYTRLVRLEVDLAARSVALTPAPVPSAGPSPASARPAGPAGAPVAAPPGPASPSAAHLELPAFNAAFAGRRHRFVYGCSAVFEEGCVGLMKVDMDTRQAQRWSPGPGYICMEPAFVPRLPAAAARRPAPGAVLGGGMGAASAPGLPPALQGRQRSEDDGWLLVHGFDSQQRRSELLVFDAWALMAGPVARLRLPQVLPLGLYGTWTDTCFF